MRPNPPGGLPPPVWGRLSFQPLPSKYPLRGEPVPQNRPGIPPPPVFGHVEPNRRKNSRSDRLQSAAPTVQDERNPPRSSPREPNRSQRSVGKAAGVPAIRCGSPESPRKENGYDFHSFRRRRLS